jgi:hypothetical protein
VSSVLAGLHPIPLNQRLINPYQLIYKVIDSLLAILDVDSVAALEILGQDLFQVLVQLFCSLVFRKMLLVVFDKLLDLVLELLLGQATVEALEVVAA